MKFANSLPQPCPRCGVARGNTPLHMAARGGATEVVELLIAANTPLEVNNSDGRRPQPGHDQYLVDDLTGFDRNLSKCPHRSSDVFIFQTCLFFAKHMTFLYGPAFGCAQDIPRWTWRDRKGKQTSFSSSKLRLGTDSEVTEGVQPGVSPDVGLVGIVGTEAQAVAPRPDESRPDAESSRRYRSVFSGGLLC